MRNLILEIKNSLSKEKEFKFKWVWLLNWYSKKHSKLILDIAWHGERWKVGPRLWGAAPSEIWYDIGPFSFCMPWMWDKYRNLFYES